MTGTRDLLAEHPFLAGIEPYWLDRLTRRPSVFRPAEHRLFHEGLPAQRFWLLRSGRVALDIHTPGRGDVLLETVGPGTMLGWSWLFEPYQWHFGAITVEPVRAIEFDAAGVRRLMADDPAFGHPLSRRFMSVLFDRLQATRVRLLDLYAYPEAPRLLSAAQVKRRWRPGTARRVARRTPTVDPARRPGTSTRHVDPARSQPGTSTRDRRFRQPAAGLPPRCPPPARRAAGGCAAARRGSGPRSPAAAPGTGNRARTASAAASPGCRPPPPPRSAAPSRPHRVAVSQAAESASPARSQLPGSSSCRTAGRTPPLGRVPGRPGARRAGRSRGPARWSGGLLRQHLRGQPGAGRPARSVQYPSSSRSCGSRPRPRRVRRGGGQLQHLVAVEDLQAGRPPGRPPGRSRPASSRHRLVADRTSVGVPYPHGLHHAHRGRDGAAWPGPVIRASRSGAAGSGIRSTRAVQPSATSATRAWCSAAPQLSVISRPSGSVAASWRSRTRVQLQRVGQDPPAPRLGVVHRRCVAGRRGGVPERVDQRVVVVRRFCHPRASSFVPIRGCGKPDRARPAPVTTVSLPRRDTGATDAEVSGRAGLHYARTGHPPEPIHYPNERWQANGGGAGMATRHLVKQLDCGMPGQYIHVGNGRTSSVTCA